MVESEIIKWGTSSFRVRHRSVKGKLLAVKVMKRACGQRVDD